MPTIPDIAENETDGSPKLTDIRSRLRTSSMRYRDQMNDDSVTYKMTEMQSPNAYSIISSPYRASSVMNKEVKKE